MCDYVQDAPALQYVSAGEDYTDNQDACPQLVRDRGLDPSRPRSTNGPPRWDTSWRSTGARRVKSFDEWNQAMIDNGNVPKDFNWKDHVDFSCVTAAQKKLGLPLGPGQHPVARTRRECTADTFTTARRPACGDRLHARVVRRFGFGSHRAAVVVPMGPGPDRLPGRAQEAVEGAPRDLDDVTPSPRFPGRARSSVLG